MKIDFTKIITDLAGEPLTRPKGEEKIPVSFAYAVTEALMGLPADEQSSLKGEERYKRAKLADKIYSSLGECEITAEEASLIKMIVGKMWTGVVVLRIWDAIEGR